jgi:hypothetical protein
MTDKSQIHTGSIFHPLSLHPSFFLPTFLAVKHTALDFCLSPFLLITRHWCLHVSTPREERNGKGKGQRKMDEQILFQYNVTREKMPVIVFENQ